MQRDTQAIIRSLLRSVRSPAKIISTVAFVILSLSGSNIPSTRAASAQPPGPTLSGPLEIKNDYGGLLLPRLRQIRTLRQTGQAVRITGRICYSTCTLLIGLPQTCISPRTRFGFHGPSSYGRALPADLFESASRTIAAHYPEPLRAWYLSTGRYKLNGFYVIRGDQMIRLGLKPC